jgi:hypothetical protein
MPSICQIDFVLLELCRWILIRLHGVLAHCQTHARPVFYFPVATIWVTGGSKVLEFYEALAKQRATSLEADGKDILSVKIHMDSKRQAE